MIEPNTATAIILVFLITWALVIPICGAIPKVKSIISYRYLVLTVFLACMIGVIIDFSELETSVRLAVIIGAAVLSGFYIIIRSVEKWIANDWTFKHNIEASVSKGDTKAEVKITDSSESHE